MSNWGKWGRNKVQEEKRMHSPSEKQNKTVESKWNNSRKAIRGVAFVWVKYFKNQNVRRDQPNSQEDNNK